MPAGKFTNYFLGYVKKEDIPTDPAALHTFMTSRPGVLELCQCVLLRARPTPAPRPRMPNPAFSLPPPCPLVHSTPPSLASSAPPSLLPSTSAATGARRRTPTLPATTTATRTHAALATSACRCRTWTPHAHASRPSASSSRSVRTTVRPRACIVRAANAANWVLTVWRKRTFRHDARHRVHPRPGPVLDRAAPAEPQVFPLNGPRAIAL